MKNQHQLSSVFRATDVLRWSALCITLAGPAARAELRIESSLPAEKDHAVAAVADGSRETWFQSSRPPRSGDAVTLYLGKPQKLTSIRILTGTPKGGSRFENALLELSEDGATFTAAAPLKNGEAEWSGSDKPVAAVRIRALSDSSDAVAIREIALDDELLRRVTVTLQGSAPFGRLTARCNFSNIPGEYAVLMRDQLDLTAAWFFTFYPQIVALLDAPTEGLLRDLEIRFSNEMKPGVPGFVSGGVMTLSIPHTLRNPADVRGLVIHELTHIAQAYSAPGERPGWLVEGIAEAVRYQLSPADDPWRREVDRIDPQKLDYRNAYRDNALFLRWVESRGHPQLIRKLNRALKNGSYTKATWAELTGKDPDTWLREYRTAKGQINF